MRQGQAMVLTFHSVSEGGGPTSIPPAVFARQMAALAELGYRTLKLEELLAWLDGEPAPLERRVLITFDDGFCDFRQNAMPILSRHGFSALMFLPTGKLGGRDDWPGGEGRPLMSWRDVAELAQEDVEFGAHGIRHLNLDLLDAETRRIEIARSGEELEAKLGRRVRSFAAPYGRAGPAARADIAAHYQAAFGTRLGLASRGDDRFDLPRIEMHYFRDPRRWRSFLQGRSGYLHARRMLRGVRERLGAGWGLRAQD